MEKYLIAMVIIYNLGLYGIIGSKKHFILMLIAFELVLVGLSVVTVIISVQLDDMTGIFYAILVITIGAAESALGLTIIVIFYKLNGSISLDYATRAAENGSVLKR